MPLQEAYTIGVLGFCESCSLVQQQKFSGGLFAWFREELFLFVPRVHMWKGRRCRSFDILLYDIDISGQYLDYHSVEDVSGTYILLHATVNFLFCS